MEFDDGDALRRELDANLVNGGTLAPYDDQARVGSRCDVVLVHPGDRSRISLASDVVMVNDSGPMAGVAVQFIDFNKDVVDKITGFIERGEKTEAGGAVGGSIQARVRNLSAGDRTKMAREGEIGERVALERIYGKEVWASLLRNTRLTVPEVVRIARMPQLPQPQLDIILDNRQWLAAAQVRRALLSNTNLPAAGLQKILSMTPKGELKLMPKQTAYPHNVRQAAQKLMKNKR